MSVTLLSQPLVTAAVIGHDDHSFQMPAMDFDFSSIGDRGTASNAMS